MKLKELLHSQVPEEGGPAYHSGDRVRGAPGSTLSQAGGGPRGERGPTGRCLCWAQMEYTSIGREVSSLVCLNVTSSQSGKGRKGNLW